jgi:hypothetical protein
VIYTNGKSKTIATTDKDLEIYSVSNQGKCIYAIDDVNAQLCFIDQQGEIKELQNDISADQIWGTNLAGTEIAFCKDNSIYISAYGTEKKKLFSSQYNNMSIVNTWEGSLELENTYEDSQVLESFASHFYLSDETLYYVDQNFEKTKVADEVMEASVTEDEKTVFYAYGERRAIYKYNASTETKEKIVDYEDFYLDYFLITPDGKDLYYINKYSEDTVGLYYYDGKEAVLITDDIESIYEIFIYNGMLFYEYGEYYIDDFRGDKQREGSSAVHDLYCYQKEKKCDQIVAEGIPSSTGYGALWSTTPSLMENIYAGNNTMGYCVLDGGTMEYFVSASGTKFQSVLEINYDLNSD